MSPDTQREGQTVRGRDPRHGDDGRVVGWLALLLVLVLGAGAFVVYRTDLADPWLEDGWAADRLAQVFGEQQPARLDPPDGLDLAEAVAPAAAPVAEPVQPRVPDAAAVRAALAPLLGDDDLGRHVLVAVGGLDDAAPVFAQGRGTAVPASTTKLLTGLAALAVLDPERRFETRTVRAGRRLTLVGGGDPLLAAAPDPDAPERADVTTLARRTARALRADGVRRVRLEYDQSLFTGPAVNPTWRADYVPDGVVAPTSALWVDRGVPASGRGRVADPALAAAQTFAAALADAGVAVAGGPRPAAAPAGTTQGRPADEATALAAVTGPTVAQLVEHAVLVSDNEVTEALLRHVGLAVAGEGSTEAGVAAVRQSLVGLGVDVAGLVLHDGSGLSRANRIAPATLLGVLRVAATDPRPQLRTLLTSLPVAAFSGSLSERFSGPASPVADPAGRGRVRAKTGTLTGVSSLAGIATGVDGTPMLFAVMADRVGETDTLGARDAIDAAAAALAGCRCGVPAG